MLVEFSFSFVLNYHIGTWDLLTDNKYMDRETEMELTVRAPENPSGE